MDDATAACARVVERLEARGVHVDHARVANATDLEQALDHARWDVVVANHDARELKTASVVEALVARNLTTPVIARSGVRGGAGSRTRLESIADDADPERLAGAIMHAVEDHRSLNDPSGTAEDINNFFELSPDLLCIAGADGYFKALNPAWEAKLNISRHELMSRPYLEFVHPDDREATELAAEQAKRGRRVFAFEIRLRVADGTHRWFRWNAAASRSRDRIYATGRDITRQKRKMREMKISLSRVFEAAGEGICLLDVDGKVRFLNEAGAIMLRCDPEDANSRSFHDLVHGEHARRTPARDHCNLENAVASRRPSRASEASFVRNDGSTFPAGYTIAPIVDAGLHTGAVIVFRDVSEKARADLESRTNYRITRAIAEARDLDGALSESLEISRGLMGADVAEAWIVGADDSHLHLSPAWAGDREMFREFRNASAPSDFDQETSLAHRVLSSKTPRWEDLASAESSTPRAAAAKRAGLSNVFLVPAISSDRVIAVFAFYSRGQAQKDTSVVDLTAKISMRIGTLIDRFRAESDTRASEARFRRIVEGADDIVFRYRAEPDAGFEYVSSAAIKILGRSPEDHYAEPDIWDKLARPGDAETVRRMLNGSFEGAPEIRFSRGDGPDAVLEFHADRVLASDGSLVAVEGIARDVTERITVESELRAQRDHLARLARRLASANEELEAFSYTVSHDLRAPLRGIAYFSDALWQEYGTDLPNEGVAYLKRVRSETQQLTDLVNDLLDLSRVTRAPLRRETIDLSGLAKEILDAQIEREPDREIVSAIDAGMTVSADAHLTRIVLNNLIENAVKYSRKTPRAEITVGHMDDGHGPTFFVRDNGAGFDMAQADRLFRPFQRLHAPSEYEGTGIGLATVQRIVRLHEGRIWAESHPGRGATFYFTL